MERQRRLSVRGKRDRNSTTGMGTRTIRSSEPQQQHLSLQRTRVIWEMEPRPERRAQRKLRVPGRRQSPGNLEHL